MTTTSSPSTDFFPADQKARIIEHMNSDHGDAVLRYARYFGHRLPATSALLAGIDALGIDLVVTENGVQGPARISFEQPLGKPDDAHHVLIAMAKEARIALGETDEPDVKKKEAALARAREAAAAFRSGFRTIILGTASPEGEPDASVAPAVRQYDGAFYTYVSTLSTHTRNLLNTKRGSMLLIEDEGTAAQLLARKRLTFHCSAALVPRGQGPFEDVMIALKEKFGAIMEHLETMTDFQLIRLTPERGRLVTGFGQAFDVDPADWTKLSHVGGVGHGHAPAKKETSA